MEKSIDERKLKKYKTIIDEDKITSSNILKEREKLYKNDRKNRIKNELFFKKKHNNEESKINTNLEINNDVIIQKLNIAPNLKNEKYINELLSSDNLDTIFFYIKEIYNKSNFNIDIVKYGLYILNEKLLNLENKSSTIFEQNDFINKYNFKEIINLLLIFSKNENNKIDYDPVIIKLTYQILANYCYYNSNGEDIEFLINEKFIDFHLYFFEIISDKNILKNILLMIYNICIENNKHINKLLTFNNNKFYNLLSDYINNYKTDNDIIEIILDLLICYINIFNNNINQIKKEKKKDDLIEMKDNTIKYDFNLIENIYDLSLILIYNKQNTIFSNSIFLISKIYKILYKSNDFELMNKIINNNNTKSMILFILEKNYEDYPNDIIVMSEIIKYIIKTFSKCLNQNNQNELSLNIINLLDNIEKNLNEDEEIIDKFIFLLSFKEIKMKEKIVIKLMETISALLINEHYFKIIIENNKDDILNIIIKYINSSNYEIRKKIIKIVENITNKKDIILGDYLIKNKILYYIKNSIDPNLTYCNDEKIIVNALKVINNLISMGEIFKKLNGYNSVLVNFENIGGKELLDNLLCNKSKLVYKTSLQMIEQYYN